MSSLKILIAGAGISGPVLAFWLARIGCSVTIVERSPNLRATGQQLDLTGQAVVIMRMMGIEDAVRAALCPEPGIRFIDRQGKSIASLPASKDGERSLSRTEEIEIMRGDLVRILYDSTKNLPNVEYIFGTEVESFSQDETFLGGKVHVTFVNGTQTDYDMLVGSDGISSVTRRLMLDPMSPDPHHDMGFHIAYYTAPASADDLYDWTWCHIPGGRIVMTRKDKEDCIRVYLVMRGKCCSSLDGAKTLEQQKAAVLDIFKESDGAQLPRFLRDLRESPLSDDLYSQHMTQIRLPDGDWSRGRVVLLGDAAYSSSAGGVGTTAAFVGAYVLAGELARQWDESEQSVEKFSAEKASKEYERVVRRLVQGGGDVPHWALRIFAPGPRFGIWLLHIFVKLVVVLRIDKLLARLGTPDESKKLLYDDYFGLLRKGEHN
jgi:2-polyprenyl-6-methoxyphenol hydroxylase-like FAD-dependent oxidoreductase